MENKDTSTRTQEENTMDQKQIDAAIAVTVERNRAADRAWEAKMKNNTIAAIDPTSTAGAELLNVIAQSDEAEQNRNKPCHCQSCGATGTAGNYPFSTLGGGTCDDCI